MRINRSGWISICFINLCLVALLGVILRSKILFSIPSINFRNVLSAHSHFAFAGWAGLCLMTLLIFDLLPENRAHKNVYGALLISVELSSLGMAFCFPFFGYNALTIFFSTAYIVAMLVFAPLYIKDVLKSSIHKTVKLLSISGLSFLIISFVGTLGLVYILAGKSTNSLLYRDSIYFFLHFQYNGFFTLSVFALFLNYLSSKGIVFGKIVSRFALFLVLSVAPTLFLSMLWHNNALIYAMAGIGCLLVIISLFYYFKLLRLATKSPLFSNKMAYWLWIFSTLSFSLKMILNVGTILPQLSDAVYSDHPLIIGFLHLVFLGFFTFYVLATFIQNGYFSIKNKTVTYPFIIFSIGIFGNEFTLMLQGLSILLHTNSPYYNWFLLAASILLLSGAILIAATRFMVIKKQRMIA
ncbi:MAG: hypothetical protein ABIN57_04230 [Chitinophagaceae bacterium]